MYSGWQLITWLSGGILRCWWLDDGRQVSASFHPSPFIKDGLIPGIPNGGFFGVDRMWLWEPEQHMKWSDFEIRTQHPTNHKRKILGCGEIGKCSCSNKVYFYLRCLSITYLFKYYFVLCLNHFMLFLCPKLFPECFKWMHMYVFQNSQLVHPECAHWYPLLAIMRRKIGLNKDETNPLHLQLLRGIL